jgi:hypothetical protein
VGPRAGLDAVVKREKFLTPAGNRCFLNLSSIKSSSRLPLGIDTCVLILIKFWLLIALTSESVGFCCTPLLTELAVVSRS